MSVTISDGFGSGGILAVNSDGSINISGTITTSINISGLLSYNANHYASTVNITGLSLGLQENVETVFIQNTGSVVGLWYYLNGSVASGATLNSGGYIGMLGGLSFDIQLGSNSKISLAAESGVTATRITTLY